MKQRLMKLSAQVCTYVKTYYSTIAPSPYEAFISDLQLLLTLLELACMLKKFGLCSPYLTPADYFYSFPSGDLCNNHE